ncbi:hypothetical protein SAMN05421837_102772 [Amycolatopsis pretoriensis]|uniref:Uncharacterized protein n=1 Tax=Amycolatopsis pretoriensis TaxID=218821 RepID=A0A1H5QEL5_9PSEU|nr:hypothetical protein SAMN05421837_102772 [Amycolatopsis pretoriensis]
MAELRKYPGIHQAHAALTGHRDNPALALVVSVNQDRDPVAVRERLAAEGLPRLRHGNGWLS